MTEDFGSSKDEETRHWKGGVEEEKKECTPQRPHLSCPRVISLPVIGKLPTDAGQWETLE